MRSAVSASASSGFLFPRSSAYGFATGMVRPTLSRKHSDGAKRRAASAAYFHWQRDDVRASHGQAIERGEILERRDVVRVQLAMRFEQRRWSVIDARRVDADRANLPVGHDPARRIGIQAGEMQAASAFLTSQLGAQVPFRSRPSRGEPRPEQDDRIQRNLAVLLFEALEVGDRDL